MGWQSSYQVDKCKNTPSVKCQSRPRRELHHGSPLRDWACDKATAPAAFSRLCCSITPRQNLAGKGEASSARHGEVSWPGRGVSSCLGFHRFAFPKSLMRERCRNHPNRRESSIWRDGGGCAKNASGAVRGVRDDCRGASESLDRNGQERKGHHFCQKRWLPGLLGVNRIGSKPRLSDKHWGHKNAVYFLG